MSIEADIMTALASVASGKVYPDAAPQDAVAPFVIVKQVSSNPLWTLQGYAGTTQSSFLFESWGLTKASAMAVRDAVFSAIEAAAAITTKTREDPGGEGYDEQTDQFMMPAQYSIWHA